MAGDDIIDESVVRISPDLTGFRKSLQAKLKTATAGVTAKVRLQADATGWAASVRKELAGRPQATAKVRLVADARSFQKSINDALRSRGGVHGNIGVSGGGGSGGGGGRAGGGGVISSFGELGGLKNARHIHERIAQNLRELEAAEKLHLKRRRNAQEDYEADRAAAQDAQLARDRKRFRSYGEMLDHFQNQATAWDRKRNRTHREMLDQAHEQALTLIATERQRKDEKYVAFTAKINDDLNKIREGASADEIRIAQETDQELARINRIGRADHIANLSAIEKAEQESNRRIERERTRAAAARRKMLSPITKASEANGLIDLGGRGIRPGNIPIVALVALSPALLSIASSATLAASSVAAIGAAGLGAVAGVTALVVGFSRIREALSLREQVRKEEARNTASAAVDAHAERSRARAVAEARAAVNVAYRDAAKYVKDLREELSDLALQERQDALDVASAKERLAAVNNNFWATDLEKRQAALDVQKALDDQGDTKRDQATKRKELNKLEREGLGQSKQVLEARERLADAQLAQTSATIAASAASQDLAAKFAALSPAAKEMYNWFDRNQGVLDGMRTKMEQAVLPGFLTFLEAVTDRGRKGKGTSTLDIIADGAARLGRVIGTTVGELGEMSKLPWFRKDIRKVNTENEKSFRLLGRAALTLVKPLLRITAVSSPLFTRFSKWLLKLTEQFADFIDKADSNGTLVQWFKDAGDEAAKWGRILTNVLGFLKSVFSASLPTGKDLVTRIGDATEQLNAWAKKPEGKAALEKFFKFFQDIDYNKLRDFAFQIGLVIGSLKVFTFGRKHPFWALLTLLASSDMETAGKVLSEVSDIMLTMLGWVKKYPVEAATLLAVVTGLSAMKSATIGLKMVGLGGLADKIAGVFGKATATMNVTAGVVNVVGGAGGLPGVPGGKTPGGKTPATLPKSAGGGKVALAATAATVVFGGIEHQGRNERTKDLFSDEALAKNRADLGMGRKIGGGTWASNTPLERAAAIKREADTYKELNRAVVDNSLRVKDNSAASANGNHLLQDYIRTRRESVDATVANTLATSGDRAAMRDLDAQNRASKDTLVKVLTQMGWNTEAAKKYADKVYAIPLARKTTVGLPDIKAREAELKNVNKQIDALTGTKTAIVKILPGSDADKQLKNLVIQQMALSKNMPYSQAKNLYEKHERLAMMASGGPVHGNSPHPRADNIPAMLTANEYVHPVDSVKYYGTGTMDAIRQRRIPREALQRYALGGAVHGDSITNRWPFGIKMPDPFGEDIAPGFTGPLGKGGGLGSWQSLWKAVKGQFGKGVSLYSAFRRGSRTLSGALSRHALGRAIDINPTRAIAAWIMKNYGSSTHELITPWRDMMLYRGRPHKYSRAVEAQHGVFGNNRHIHWSMAGGGLVNPLPKKFDGGGRLGPGYTLAYNGTGRTETVRTAEQEKNLNAPQRIDKRDLALLAQYIAAASARPIHMDGRRVAEIVHGYNYLPGGV